MKLAKIVAACLAASVVACDSVGPSQIEYCAKACALSGQRMRRATDKECLCDPGDGGTP